MKIYKIKYGDKIITVKRVKVSSLNSQFISLPDTEIKEGDDVYVRCNKKGKVKYYNKQHIVYPISLTVVEILDRDNAIVSLFKRLIN